MVHYVICANDFKKDETEKKMHMSLHYILDDPHMIIYYFTLEHSK